MKIKSFLTVVSMILTALFLTGCQSEVEKTAAANKQLVEKSQKVLDATSEGDPDQLEMDGEPAPEGERESTAYITDEAVKYIQRCEKRKGKEGFCYEEMMDIFDRESKTIIDKLVTNINLLPNDFQRKAVSKEYEKFMTALEDCGASDVACRAKVYAAAYDFAVWIDKQAMEFKEAKQNPVDVSQVGFQHTYCATTTTPLQIYNDEGNPAFMIRPEPGKMVHFMVYDVDNGKSIAVESRDKWEPFQFNGRVIGYINPSKREELTKGGHIFACGKLNTIYVRR